MRNLLLILLIAIGLAGCSDEPKVEDVAVQTAKAYYDQLLQGDYASFVAGTAGYDSIHPSFREQLEVSMKQYVANQKKQHKGIDSIVAVRATVDTVKNGDTQTRIATAYLAICFSDSLREQIAVPMIEKNKVWMLR